MCYMSKNKRVYYQSCLKKIQDGTPVAYRGYTGKAGWSLPACTCHTNLGLPHEDTCKLKSTEGIVDSITNRDTVFPLILSVELFFFEVEICRYFHIASAISLPLCNKCCGSYFRAETIQENKLCIQGRKPFTKTVAY